LVGIDMFTQISFELAQKIFACSAIFRALRGIRIDPLEIVTSDKKFAGKTAAVLERIARGFGKLERFALALGHLRGVDDSGRRPFRLATGRVRPTGGVRAGFLSPATAGFLRRFERTFHCSTGFQPVGTPGILPGGSSFRKSI